MKKISISARFLCLLSCIVFSAFAGFSQPFEDSNLRVDSGLETDGPITQSGFELIEVSTDGVFGFRAHSDDFIIGLLTTITSSFNFIPVYEPSAIVVLEKGLAGLVTSAKKRVSQGEVLLKPRLA